MDEKKRISGANALLDALVAEGVDTVFGYPGGSIIPIYDALYDYGGRLRHIFTRHEQGAVHAAEGYARATGGVGVCFATSGPGATNLDGSGAGQGARDRCLSGGGHDQHDHPHNQMELSDSVGRRDSGSRGEGFLYRSYGTSGTCRAGHNQKLADRNGRFRV